MNIWNVKEKKDNKYTYFQLIDKKNKKILYGVSKNSKLKQKIIFEIKNNNINPNKLNDNEICISIEGINIKEELTDILNSYNKFLMETHNISITSTPPIALQFNIETDEEEKEINDTIGKYNLKYKINKPEEPLKLSKEKQALLDKWKKVPEISKKIDRLSNNKLDELLTKALNSEISNEKNNNEEEEIKEEKVVEEKQEEIKEIKPEKLPEEKEEEQPKEEKKGQAVNNTNELRVREDTRIFVKTKNPIYEDYSLNQNKKKKSIILPLIIFIISFILLIISGIILYKIK